MLNEGNQIQNLYCVPIPVPLRSANKLRFRFRYGKKLGSYSSGSGSRSKNQKSNGSQVPDPDPQHCLQQWRKTKKLQIPIGLCRPNIKCEIQCCRSGSVCFGPLDPDPLVRGMDPVSAPDPDPFTIKQKS
jgi:hypothetical protein